MDILNTLQRINACHGPSGDEAQVADAIESLARPYADEISRDAMGSLVVRKKGSGPKVMLAAHMDSIGFIVTHIDDKGLLHFGKLGWLDPNTCLHTPVRFRSGVRGLVSTDADEDKKLTLDDLYIDVGATDKAEAEKLVKLGDTAVFCGAAFSAGSSRIVSPYLDNRVSCVALLTVLEDLKVCPNDLYFVFTVQEELGTRGAQPAAYGVEPKYAIAVDVTPADEENVGPSKLGGGAAIKIMDRSVICHPQMVKKLEELAKEKGITYQLDVLREGGTDAGAIRTSRAGVCTGGVSVPCRYTHSPVEMADTRDVAAVAALVRAFAEAQLD